MLSHAKGPMVCELCDAVNHMVEETEYVQQIQLIPKPKPVAPSVPSYPNFSSPVTSGIPPSSSPAYYNTTLSYQRPRARSANEGANFLAPATTKPPIAVPPRSPRTAKEIQKPWVVHAFVECLEKTSVDE